MKARWSKQSNRITLFDQYPLALSNDYFTRALIALCYELLGEINDAYIVYKKLAESMPDLSVIIPKLYRYAVRLGFQDEAAKYKAMLTCPEEEGSAEVILFVGEGRAPKKIPGNIVLPPSIRISFPQYQYQSVSNTEIIVTDDSKRLSTEIISTSLDAVARSSLSLRGTRLITKEAARVIAKEAMARAFEKKNNDLLSALFRTVLFITEEPDTRSWETLPGALHLVRIPLKPGKHSLKISVSQWGGQQIEDISFPVTVSFGQKNFYSIRIRD